MKEAKGEEDKAKEFGWRGKWGTFFFFHKDRGEETMWEKQTGGLAGLPNVWKGPHWVNKALTGHRTHNNSSSHTHKHRRSEKTQASLIIWVRSFNPGWEEWRGLCAIICWCVCDCILVWVRRDAGNRVTQGETSCWNCLTPTHTETMTGPADGCWRLLLDGNDERAKRVKLI